MSPLVLILVILIIANVPWFTERLFLAFQMEKGKSWGWRLLELLVFYFLSLVIATMSEIRFSGDVHPQQWEFFATTFCALGNFYDRVFLNAVPDFIDLHYRNFHWFTFNVADIFITLGIIAFLMRDFFIKKQ